MTLEKKPKARETISGLLCVLGPPSIDLEGKKPLKNQKAAALLAYLAVQGTTSRERLTGLLWPDLPQAKASANLRGVIHKLKSLAPGCLEAQGEQLSLSPLWEVDIALLMSAENYRQRSRAARYRGIVCEGVSLADCDELEQWLAQLRQDAGLWQVTNLTELSCLCLKNERVEEAVESARLAVSLDPLSENAHAQLIRALVESGDTAAAHRQYNLLEKILDDEFGAQPREETRRLLQLEASLPVHNLPAPLTSFLGREQELEALESALERHRLVTVTGIGGVGKTELCLRAGRGLSELANNYDGIWLVRLAPLQDSRFLEETFRRSLSLKPGLGLEERLQPGKGLLIVDNCEHLLEETRSFLRRLLETCPRLTILATSREPLDLAGELVFRLEPFAVPEEGPEIALLRSSPSIQLLLERGRMVDSTLALDPQTAPFLARICRSLDGIPLALELAAARFKVLSPEQLADRLSDCFQLLKGRPGEEARQQTLGALLDWSFETLDPDCKALLINLSVFAGSFDPDAVESICFEPRDRPFAVERLAALVDKSLVCRAPHGRTGRYKLLETVKGYAQRFLSPRAQEDLWVRHRRYYLSLAARAEEELVGPKQKLWLQRLDDEVPNFLAAIRRASGRPEQLEDALELCLAPQRYWVIRDYRSALRKALVPLLSEAARSHADSNLMARAYRMLGEFATDQGDLPAAEEYLKQSLKIAKPLNDRRECAEARRAMGNLYYARSEFELAEESYLKARGLFEELSHQPGLNACDNNLGLVAFESGELTKSRNLFEKSWTLSVQSGDQRSIALSLTNLGHIDLKEELLVEAGSKLSEAFRIYLQIRENGYPTLQAVKGLAQLALLNREYDRCTKLLALAKKIFAEVRTPEIDSHRPSIAQIEQSLQNNPAAEQARKQMSQLRTMSMEALIELVKPLFGAPDTD